MSRRGARWWFFLEEQRERERSGFFYFISSLVKLHFALAFLHLFSRCFLQEAASFSPEATALRACRITVSLKRKKPKREPATKKEMASSKGSSSNAPVTLVSSDGAEFVIDYDAACVSNTIKHMLDSKGEGEEGMRALL